MNRHLVSRILSLVVALAVSGCHQAPPAPPAASARVKKCMACRQFDEGSYVIKNGVNPVAEVWSNKADGSTRLEFWAQDASLTDVTLLAFESVAMDTSCGAWWNRVSHRNPTPMYAQTTVSATGIPFSGTPPAPGTGVTFLPHKSYQLKNAADNSLFARIFVYGTTEYWAMDEEIGPKPLGGIPTGTMSVVPPDYTTPDGFARYLDALPARPKVWFASSYSDLKLMDPTTPPKECLGG